MSELTNNLIIRRAKQSDLDAIVSLWVELLDFHQERDPYYTLNEDAQKHTAKHIAGTIDSLKSIVLVAESDNIVIGYLIANIQQRPPAYKGGALVSISDICVNGGSRRAGAGVAMVKELIKIADKKGIDRVEVGYSARNEHSVAFWDKMGFKPFNVTAALDRSELQ
ncbi:MAG: GNAT family N-acetyltransferase [Armatimonadetes bacterium]|nr:GNAT family N-acetyltransferase [Armatimonadota bacterium]